MRWPDGTMPVDDRLADALRASTAVAPTITVTKILRHVPGRRVTALASDGDQRRIVKVFHGPRARGNDRRLRSLAEAGLADVVPVSFGHHADGRIGVLGHQQGEALDEIADDRRFVEACGLAGTALRRLHDCGAELDREWTLDDELQHLVANAPDSTAGIADAARRTHAAPVRSAAVPSHRDCHPRQVVDDGTTVHWIDLDDCALAPPGLDVGNMLAHLTREHVVGRRTAATAAAARHEFQAGYGWDGDDEELRRWEVLSMIRLAGLAEARHRDPEQRDALVALVHSIAPDLEAHTVVHRTVTA